MKLKSSPFARLMRPLLATAAFASLALSANAAGYLKLGDIKGESTDNDHKDWINLLSVSTSITRPLAADATGSTRQRGNAVLGDLVCVKELDKSTPKLMEAICLGTVIPTLELELTQPSSDGTGAPSTYLRYELKNVIVTSYSVSGATDGDTVPTESFSLNYEEIKVTYTVQGTAAGGNVEFEWKVEEGE